MATSKTLTPTNQTISIPELSDAPDMSVPADAIDKEADAINSLNNNKVSGPSSATNNQVAVFDGTTGKAIKDSGYTIAKSVPSNALFTDTTYSVATTSANGLMSSADKTKLNNMSLASSGNWWEAPAGVIKAYKYEGANTTTYKLPYSNCVVFVVKESNSRGVAYCIRWANSETEAWIARLHDDTASSNFSSWTKLITAPDAKQFASSFAIGCDFSSKKVKFTYTDDNEYTNFMISFAGGTSMFCSIGWDTSQTSISPTNIFGSPAISVTKSKSGTTVTLLFTRGSGTGNFVLTCLSPLFHKNPVITTVAK